MKIVFFATPSIALYSIEALEKEGFEIAGFVTQPDKPAGRGRKLTPPPVKVYALERGKPVLQPAKLKDPEFLRALEDLQPQMIAVLAYGKILPPAVLQLPPLGCFNLHFSLLPKYRGAAPVQWAILNGETKTGLTVFKMDEGMDTGPILTQMEIEIKPGETYGELEERMAKEGAPFFARSLKLWAEGRLRLKPQNHSEATYAPKIKKEMAALTWQEEAPVLERKIRAFNPSPKAWVPFKGGRLFLLRAEARYEEGRPGEILRIDRDGILVAAAKGSLLLKEVQREGKKAMDAYTFSLGARLKPGELLQ